MSTTITGLFPDRSAAERALNNLAAVGFETRLLSVPSEETRYYQGSVEKGNVLVAVEAQERVTEAKSILLRSGALTLGPEDQRVPAATSSPAGRGDGETKGTIGGITQSAVTDAAPAPGANAVPPKGEDDIGGVAPAAVSNAAPQTASTSDSRNADLLVRRTPGAPADTTVVSPGMETPYTERRGASGDSTGQHPITDEDIIAEAQRQRERDQSADLDVAPVPTERSDSPPSDR